jgi:hypothetical protein
LNERNEPNAGLFEGFAEGKMTLKSFFRTTEPNKPVCWRYIPAKKTGHNNGPFLSLTRILSLAFCRLIPALPKKTHPCAWSRVQWLPWID